MESLKKLNNLDYSDYNGLHKYLTTGKIPNTVDRDDHNEYKEQFKNFEGLENGVIRYIPRNLEVVPDNEKYKHTKLKELYQQFPSHGITQFYEIVRTYFLNLTKKETTEYLKRQIPYQLTRELPKPKFKTKQYYAPNKAWSIDLMDMSSQADRRGYVWILTVVDLYNARVWLRPLKRKLAEHVQRELASIFEHDTPRVILSDNGGEFSLKPFYAEHNVKWISSPSHTPLPHVERTNRNVRKNLREYQVRHKSLQWVDHLPDIEENLNHYNLVVNPPKPVAVEDRQKRNTVGLTPKFKRLDHVRIKLTALYPAIRAAVKAGTSKTIPIKYSVYTYRISNVYKSTSANGLPYYSLMNDNDETIVNATGKPLRYKQQDILKVSAQNEGDIVTLADAKKLNKL